MLNGIAAHLKVKRLENVVKTLPDDDTFAKDVKAALMKGPNRDGLIEVYVPKAYVSKVFTR